MRGSDRPRGVSYVTHSRGPGRHRGQRYQTLRAYAERLSTVLGNTDGRFVYVPVRDSDGALHGLQRISPDGVKKFLTGTVVRGNYHVIGDPKKRILITEGYATAATLYECITEPVAVAFSAGNLQPVAEAVRAKYVDMEIVICADNDQWTEGHPGLTKARAAARAVGGRVAIPDFGPDRPEGATDLNDMVGLSGMEAVSRAVKNASAPERREGEPGDLPTPSKEQRPEPQPLAIKIDPEPYPVDALPDTMHAAVEEVRAFTKAPVALVASSALAALSLAIQAHADIKRAEKLTGPIGLFLLTIADSGERKSTCDGFFIKAIREYEAEQTEAMKPALESHKAEMDAWTAECDGLLSAIKDASKKGKAIGKLRADLAELQHQKPEPLRVPRLLLGDETPGNLAWFLARKWPSAGVVSSEAGLILGARGMCRDSVMRNLALLNVLWDGGEHSVGRRTSESFIVKGARLGLFFRNNHFWPTPPLIPRSNSLS